MYETYEAREGMEELRPYGKGGREEMPTRILEEDSIPSSRRPKRDSGWVFVSRKADIGIVIVMILAVGLAIMWLVSRLPFFLEAASANYSWAMDMYATWGTPSMRWLVINVVVGVIVATSGLLSAFGGDGVKQEAERETGYDADRVYGSTNPSSYSSGYRNEAPAYSPYLDSALHHGAWNFGGHERVLERDPTEEMAEVTASPDHHARGDVSREMPRPREIPREVPLAEEMPREMSREEPMPTDIPVPVTESAEVEAPSDLAESREVPMPEPAEVETAEEVPALEHISEPEFSAGSRGGSEVEIISKTLDPVTEQEEQSVPPEGSNSPTNLDVVPQSHTFTIGRVIRRDQLGEFLEPLARKLEGVTKKVRSFNAEPLVSNEISAPPPPVEESDALPAPQTLPLPLPGPGTHRRRDSKESLVDDPEPVSHRQRHLTEPADEVESVSHRRRHSADTAQRSEPMPVGRRPSVESMHRQESGRRWQSGEASSPPVIPSRKERFSTPPFTNPPPAEGKKAGSPPASPLLRQRSLVYPPALYSQASIPSSDASAPPSPPMEEAIPPPPPPHLKLPPGRQITNLSTDKLPSFKFNVPSPSSPAKTPAAFGSGKLPDHSSSTQSTEFKKPPSSRHSRTRSAQALEAESPSSRAQFERSFTGRSHRSSPVREEEIQQVNDAPKEDDLHQQIEDFLAKFHDNWRLQRQESLARYRKRLVELDEGGP